jgi:hypothetical protein
MRSAVVVVTVVCLGALASIHAQSRASAPVRQVAYLKASNTEANDHFGNGGTLLGDSVAISGDGNTIAIGAPNESSSAKGVNGNQNDNSLYSAGAVYVFTRNGNTWAQQAYVKASNPQMSAEFGHIVVLSAEGNTMAVSAYFESSAAKGVNGDQTDTSIPQAGAVYVFTRQGTRWTQQAYIKASNTGEAGVGDNFGDGDQFGFSLAISDDGNTVAVGANAEDSNAMGINGNQNDNSMVSAGAVYVFARTGTTWAQQAYVKASNTRQNTQFGYAVALSADGNTLAATSFDEAGASREINGPQAPGRNGSGAAYIFTRAGGTWTQTAYLKASNAEQNDSLGVSAAISDDGNTVLIGSLDEDCLATGVNPADPTCANDVMTDTSAGAAYVFVRSGSTWTQQAFIKASNTGENDWFGSRLTISGDGNTLAIPAQLEDSNAKGINGNQTDDSATEAGAVYVFTRTGTNWSQIAYVKAANNEAFDEFGSSVALSRDGRTMVVGARAEDSAAKGVNGNQNDNSADEAGAAYVFAVTPPAAGASSR